MCDSSLVTVTAIPIIRLHCPHLDQVPHIGNALGEGGITLTDTLSELEDTLASSGFSAASDQQLQEARDSYTQQFGHQDQSRAITQNAGVPPQQQQGNPGPAPVARDGNGAEQQPPQAEPLPICLAIHQLAVGTSPLTDSGLEATDLWEFLEWHRLCNNSGESSMPKKKTPKADGVFLDSH
ncbi:hypothetical protein RSAG8_12499, partial [Rhizoctonia solani AG-8 WAC10335]